MELKRTARDITDNRGAFPIHSQFHISSRSAAGYSFARAIMEKYGAGGEYGLPSASFVYLDSGAAEEEHEAVRELVNQILVFNRIHVSALHETYEKKYYLAVRMRCEQLFARLGQSLVWRETLRELERVYRESERAAEMAADGQTQMLAEQAEWSEQSARREQRLREMEARIAAGTLAGVVPGRKAAGKQPQLYPGTAVLSSWKSEQARQFFWRIQRAEKWEQRLVFAAAGVGSLTELQRRLSAVGQEEWSRSLAHIHERSQLLIEDREFLAGLVPEIFAVGIGSVSAESGQPWRKGEEVSAEADAEPVSPDRRRADRILRMARAVAGLDTDEWSALKAELVKGREEEPDAGHRSEESGRPVIRMEAGRDAAGDKQAGSTVPEAGISAADRFLSIEQDGGTTAPGGWFQRVAEVVVRLDGEAWEDFKAKLFEAEAGSGGMDEAVMDGPVFTWIAEHKDRKAAEDVSSPAEALHGNRAAQTGAEKTSFLEAVFEEYAGGWIHESGSEAERIQRQGNPAQGADGSGAVRALFRANSVLAPFVDWEAAGRAMSTGGSEPESAAAGSLGGTTPGEWCLHVAEAVSWLDLEQWKKFKEELLQAGTGLDGMRKDAGLPDSPVIAWITGQRKSGQMELEPGVEQSGRDGLETADRSFPGRNLTAMPEAASMAAEKRLLLEALFAEQERIVSSADEEREKRDRDGDVSPSGSAEGWRHQVTELLLGLGRGGQGASEDGQSIPSAAMGTAVVQDRADADMERPVFRWLETAGEPEEEKRELLQLLLREYMEAAGGRQGESDTVTGRQDETERTAVRQRETEQAEDSISSEALNGAQRLQVYREARALFQKSHVLSEFISQDTEPVYEETASPKTQQTQLTGLEEIQIPEAWYLSVAEAITWMDSGQWEIFKEEIFGPEAGAAGRDGQESFLSRENSLGQKEWSEQPELDSPLFQWLKSQREGQERASASSAVSASMAMEKQTLYQALLEERSRLFVLRQNATGGAPPEENLSGRPDGLVMTAGAGTETGQNTGKKPDQNTGKKTNQITGKNTEKNNGRSTEGKTAKVQRLLERLEESEIVSRYLGGSREEVSRQALTGLAGSRGMQDGGADDRKLDEPPELWHRDVAEAIVRMEPEAWDSFKRELASVAGISLDRLPAEQGSEASGIERRTEIEKRIAAEKRIFLEYLLEEQNSPAPPLELVQRAMRTVSEEHMELVKRQITFSVLTSRQRRMAGSEEWLTGEQGREAAVHVLEKLRQSRMTFREPKQRLESKQYLEPGQHLESKQYLESKQHLQPGQHLDPGQSLELEQRQEQQPEQRQEQQPEQEQMLLPSASFVVPQGGTARERGRPSQADTLRREVKNEVARQVQEQTTDIQFVTRSQTVKEEISAENRTELNKLIRRVEEQQKELEELRRRQEVPAQTGDAAQVSKAVMKRLRGQFELERLRHGR